MDTNQFDERAQETLHQAVIVRVTTIAPDGYPHTVPVWFLLDGEELILFSSRDTRKVKNVLSNPRGALAIGGDPVGSPCYLVVGDFTVEDDPDHVVTARITRHYEPPERAEEWLQAWEGEDFVVLRLKPRQVVRIS
jgi:general stress protein 26